MHPQPQHVLQRNPPGATQGFAELSVSHGVRFLVSLVSDHSLDHSYDMRDTGRVRQMLADSVLAERC